MSWLDVLRNEYMTQLRHCVAVVDDYGNIVPVSSEYPLNYHFCGWQYTRNGIMSF